jgi:hypothetical protein
MLKVYWWEVCTTNSWIVVCTAVCEIGFYVCEEQVVGFWWFGDSWRGIFSQAFGLDALSVAAGVI